MSQPTLRVLVTEASFDTATDVIKALKDIGCEVSTCHSWTGLCRGLAPGGRCPLDDARPVDLVVDVRGREPELTTREFGVMCGIRAGLRVVVVGADTNVPATKPAGLESRVTVTTLDQLVAACRTAIMVRRRMAG